MEEYDLLVGHNETCGSSIVKINLKLFKKRKLIDGFIIIYGNHGVFDEEQASYHLLNCSQNHIQSNIRPDLPDCEKLGPKTVFWAQAFNPTRRGGTNEDVRIVIIIIVVVYVANLFRIIVITIIIITTTIKTINSVDPECQLSMTFSSDFCQIS